MSELFRYAFFAVLLVGESVHAQYYSTSIHSSSPVVRYNESKIQQASEALANDASSEMPCPNELIDQVANRDTGAGTIFDNLINAHDCAKVADGGLASDLEENLKRLGYAKNQGTNVMACIEKRVGHLDNRTAKAVVLNYYYLMDRMSTGAVANVMGIADIDHTLGATPLHGVAVPSQKLLPGVKDAMDKIKADGTACGSNGGQMARLVDETKLAATSFKKLRFLHDRSLRTAGAKVQSKKFKQKMDALTDLYPWLKNPDFQSPQPMSDQAVRVIIDGHLNKVRAALVEQNKQLAAGADCLHNPHANGCFKSFMSTIDKTAHPDWGDRLSQMQGEYESGRTSLNGLNEFGMGKSDLAQKIHSNNIKLNEDIRDISSTQSIGKCFQNLRGNQRGVDQAYGMLADAGILAGTTVITALTAGTGATVVGASGAAAAGRLGAMALRAARTVAVAYDVGSSGVGFAKALGDCAQENIATAQAASSQGCSSTPSAARAMVQNETRSCTLGLIASGLGVVGAGVNLKQIVKVGTAAKAADEVGSLARAGTQNLPKGHIEKLTTLTSAKDRGAAAAQDLGLSLSPAEQKAFDAALESSHSIGGGSAAYRIQENADGTSNLITNLSFGQKRDKLKALIDGGISPDNARKLLDRGWAGTPDLLGQLNARIARSGGIYQTQAEDAELLAAVGQRMRFLIDLRGKATIAERTELVSLGNARDALRAPATQLAPTSALTSTATATPAVSVARPPVVPIPATRQGGQVVTANTPKVQIPDVTRPPPPRMGGQPYVPPARVVKQTPPSPAAAPEFLVPKSSWGIKWKLDPERHFTLPGKDGEIMKVQPIVPKPGQKETAFIEIIDSKGNSRQYMVELEDHSRSAEDTKVFRMIHIDGSKVNEFGKFEYDPATNAVLKSYFEPGLVK